MELNHELGDTLPQKNRLPKDLNKLITGVKTWSHLTRHVRLWCRTAIGSVPALATIWQTPSRA